MDTGGKNNNLLNFSEPGATGKRCSHKTGMEFYDSPEQRRHCNIFLYTP